MRFSALVFLALLFLTPAQAAPAKACFQTFAECMGYCRAGLTSPCAQKCDEQNLRCEFATRWARDADDAQEVVEPERFADDGTDVRAARPSYLKRNGH
jgi:hypothetical protein